MKGVCGGQGEIERGEDWKRDKEWERGEGWESGDED